MLVLYVGGVVGDVGVGIVGVIVRNRSQILTFRGVDKKIFQNSNG